MAGLFGGLLGGGPNFTDPNLTLASGLLGGTGNFGANLGAGLLAAQQSSQANRQFSMLQEAQERANRANDLQVISGLYQTALVNDMIRAKQDQRAGIAHTTDPLLLRLQSQMGALAGLPAMSGGSAASTPNPAPAMGVPPSGAPSASSSPVGQNFLGANPNYQPLPASFDAPQQAQPLQVAPQSQPAGNPSFQDMRDDADMYALLARKPELMAENRYKLSTPGFSRGVSFNPATGMPIAGFVDNLPVRFDAQGNPQIIPSDIPNAIASREGAIAGAKAKATAPYTFLTIPGANRTMSIEQARRLEQGAAGFPTPAPATNAPAPSIASAGPTIAPAGYQGSGLSGPDPVALAKAEAEARGVSEQYAKAYGEMRESASQAPYQLAMLDQMRTLANGALNGQLGAIAPFKQKLGEWMMSMGATSDTVNKTLNINVPDAQEFVKLALQRAMAQTRSLGSREAYAVFQQVAAGNPNLALTTEGVSKILAPLIAEQHWNMDRFNAADDWMANKRSLAGFESNWNKTTPFSRYWQQQQGVTAGTQPAPLPANVVQLPNGKLARFPSPEAAAQFRAHIGAAQ